MDDQHPSLPTSGAPWVPPAAPAPPPPPTPPTPATATADPLARQPYALHWRGDTGELFRIWMGNLLRIILSLGIYRFWAEARFRGYVYSHIQFLDRPFGWHATGRERFLGFLKGLGILAIGAGGMVPLYIGCKEVWGPVVAGVVVQVVIGLFFLVLQPWLTVGKLRFFFSRTSWSGIRMRFRGTPAEFAKIFFPGWILTMLTLGIYFPWLLNRLLGWYIGRTQLGDRKASYDGSGGQLFRIYLKGMFLTVITFGIYLPWLQATVTRYLFDHTRLGGMTFDCRYRGLDQWLVMMVSSVMITFSLGLAYPLAIQFALETFFSRLRVMAHRDELDSLMQTQDTEASASAQGLEEAAEVLDSLSGLV